MLAGQIKRVAQEVLQELNTLGIQEILAKAIGLSNMRASLQPPQFAAQANAIRTEAEQVKLRATSRHFPNQLQKQILSGPLAAIMPRRIADVIIAGFPNDAGAAMTVNELRLYSENVNNQIAMLSNIVVGANALGVEDINVPEGRYAIDVTVPRELISNDVITYLKLMEKFALAAADVSELHSLTRSPPELIYASTTNPVIAFGLHYEDALCYLTLFSTFLTVAEKQLGLLKTLRDFFGTKLTPENESLIKDQAARQLETEYDRALDAVVQEIASPSHDSGRRNELRVSLRQKTPALVEAVMNGARVTVSVESLKQLTLDTAQGPSALTIRIDLDEQQRLATQVSIARAALGHEPVALLGNLNSSEHA